MIFFYFLISQMPLDQDPTWGKFLGMATLIKYVGFLCILYALLHIATRRAAPHYFATVQARIFFVFLIVNFVSYWTMGSKFSIQFSPFTIYVSMAFLFFVVLSIVDTLPHLRWTLLAAVAAMGWASLYVMRAWIKHPMWRPGGATGDANYFALDACLVLPLAFLFTWQSRVFWERVFSFGCLVATIGSTFLGGSRGGMLAVGAAFLWLLWHAPRRLRNFTVLAILIIPPLLLSPFSPVRRLIHPVASDETGERNRLIAWKAGLRMIEQHPIVGIGLGQFKPKMDLYADPGTWIDSIAHNTYLEVTAETGLPNFLIFVAMLFFTYRSLSRVRRRASSTGPPLVHLAATGIQAGLVGFMVGAFFLSAEHMKLFWLMVFLSMVLPSFLPARAEERDKNGRKKKTSFEVDPQNEGLGVVGTGREVPSFRS
jgi:hypothetical protein